jgi:GTPase
MQSAGYTVAIVGRPNVGKSTLFNRLVEQRKAIVDDESGVTRDRQYGIAEWNGKQFNVIDTGGFVANSDDVFEKEIKKQVLIALDEANAIIFVNDVTTGITQLDDEMAHVLRKGTKPVYVVINKVDNQQRQLDATEFYALGFEKLYFLSSISGSGTGELLDDVVAPIPEEATIEVEDLPKIAIIGQPNVGKSSLLNALIGQERTIVSDVAGTTRDTIHTRYNLYQKDFVLIDTAGIRRKKKVEEDLEFYSVIRAIKAIDEANICLLLIDATKGISAQDINIFSLATRKGKGMVLLVNKWDLMEKSTNTARDYEKMLKEKTAPFTDYPIVFVSALTKQRIFQAIEAALKVHDNLSQKISTSKLNDFLQTVSANYKPPHHRGYAVSIKFVTQLPTKAPTFAFFANHPEGVKLPYQNYLENQMRKTFNFLGVPIRLFFRKK